MDFGYWISPEGVEREVHQTPPYTHYGHALEILGQTEPEGTPMEKLLRLGWIRISLDVINVHKMTDTKKVLIKEFILRHKEFYKEIRTVFVDDDFENKCTRKKWKALV